MCPSTAVGRTPRHTPLLTVSIQLAVGEVEAIVDCAASTSVVGKRLAKKLGVWKTARKVNISQGDLSHLCGENLIVYTSFKVFDFVSTPTSPTILRKVSLDAEVLYIVYKEPILFLS